MIQSLPDDLKKLIASKLNAKDLVSATKTSKASNRLFKPLLPFAQLLLHVAHGNQDQAEAMLQKAQQEDISTNKANTKDSLLLKLLRWKGTVTDLSGRSFKNITAFQFTLWALDRHMWQMILKYLPAEDALEQYQEHQKTGTTYELMDKKIIGEKHYDFSELKQAYQKYFFYMCMNDITNFSPMIKIKANDSEICNLLAKADELSLKIGHAQRYVPAHVAQEYLRADRSFCPLPTFKEDHLPRTYQFLDGVTLSHWFKNPNLGATFSIYRCGGPPVAIQPTMLKDPGSSHLDQMAVATLCEVRTQEHDELPVVLNKKLNNAHISRR